MGNAEAATGRSIFFPEERSGHAAVRWKHFMYVWGGYNDKEETNSQISQCLDPHIIWKYDVNTCKWFHYLVKGSVPSGRLGSCWARIGAKLVVFGGCDMRGDKNNVCILHLDKLRWSFPMPSSLSPSERNKSAAIACGNKLVIFGGYGPEPIPERHIINGKYDVDVNSFLFNRGWNNDLLAFDITTEQWTALPNQGDKPSSRAAHSFAAIGNKAFVFGGRHQHERLNDFYSLCLDTFQWTRISDNDKLSEPRGRSWHTLTAISPEQLYLFGGLDTDKQILCQNTRKRQRIRTSHECELQTGSPIANKAGCHGGWPNVAICDMMGGQLHNPEAVTYADSWIYDTGSCVWKRSFDKNVYRMWHTACRGSYAGQVLVFGGCIDSIFANSNHSNQVLVFNVQPKSLTRICLETLALHQKPEVDYRDFLPPSLYRKLESLIGGG